MSQNKFLKLNTLFNKQRNIENKIIVNPKNCNNCIISIQDKNLQTTVINHFTRELPHYKFLPKHKKRFFDGKIRFYPKNGILPVGLFPDFYIYLTSNEKLKMKYGKCKFVYKNITEKQFFQKYASPEIKIDWINDLDKINKLIKNNLNLREYQYNAFQLSCEFGRGLIQLPTRSGKSLIIYLICLALLENKNYNKENKKILIVVPDLTLYGQFFTDLQEYSNNTLPLGGYSGEEKNLINGVNICTWQSLLIGLKSHKIEKECYAIIFDEVHVAKSNEVKKVVTKFKNTSYRIGFSGTLFDNELDELNLKSIFGPVLMLEYADPFIKKGYISDFELNVIKIKYKNKLWLTKKDNSYRYVKDKVFNNKKRLELLVSLVEKSLNRSDKIVLVTDVNIKERDVIYKILKEKFDEKIFLYHTGLKVKERKKLLKYFNETKSPFCIVTNYSMFRLGITIKDLNNVILASSTKSQKRVIQMIGRSLCKVEGKITRVYDIVDLVPYLDEQYDERLNHYTLHYGDTLKIKEIQVSF